MDQDNLQPQNPESPVEDTKIGESLRRFLTDEGVEDLPEATAAPAETVETPQDPPQEDPDEGQPQVAPDVIDFQGEDGQTYKVPRALEAHLLRQADYSRKTAEVAREREAIEQMRAVNEQAYAVVQQMGPTLAEFHAAKNKMEQFNQVDWDALYDSDPILHNKLKLEARDNLDRLQNLGNVLTQAPRVLETVQTQAIATEAVRNYPLAKQLVPDFESRKDELAAVGRMYGFSESELRNTPDARAVLVLAHLAEYQRIVSGRQQVKQQVASAPPVVKPGSKNASPGASNKQAQEAVRRLRTDSSTDSVLQALRASRKAQGG